MYKKNLANKNVIKAMTIGISAALSVVTPMTDVMAVSAFADTAEPGATQGEDEKIYTQDIANEMVSESNKATEAAREVAADVDKLNTDEAYAEQNEGIKGASEELNKDLNDNTTGELVDADKQYNAALEAEDNIEKTRDESLAKLSGAETAAKNANTVIKESNEQLGTLTYEIANAETMEVAYEKYEEAKKVYEEAADAAAKAENVYEEANAAYETAVANVEAAQKAFDEAVAKGSSDLADAKQKLEDATKQANSLKKYAEAAKEIAAEAKNAADAAAQAANEALSVAESEAAAKKTEAEVAESDALAKKAEAEVAESDALAKKAAAEAAESADKKKADDEKKAADAKAEEQYKIDDISGMIYRNYTHDNGAKDLYKAAALVQYYYTYGDGKVDGKTVKSVKCDEWDNNAFSWNSTYSKVTVTFDDGTTASQWVRCYDKKKYCIKAAKNSDSETIMDESVVATWCNYNKTYKDLNASDKKEKALKANEDAWKKAYSNAGAAEKKAAAAAESDAATKKAAAAAAESDAATKKAAAAAAESDAAAKKAAAESAESDAAAKKAAAEAAESDAAAKKAAADTAADAATAANTELEARNVEYTKLFNDADAAAAAVKKAEADVIVLEDALKALLDSGVENKKSSEIAIAALKGALSNAQKELEKARENFKEAVENIENAGNELADAITRLTPNDNPSYGPGNNDNNNQGESGVTTQTVRNNNELTAEQLEALAQYYAALEAMNNNPGNVLGANRQSQSTKATVTTATKEKTAASKEVVESKTEEKQTAPVEEEKKIVEIDEQEVPLANDLTEEEKAGMSWWWLLVVAALGAAGVTAYREHQKKKAVVKTESKKNDKKTNAK